MNQKKIGAFLKELRKEKGITQEQLAEQLGVSGRTVSRWETGSNMPDISLLTDIADFYTVSIPEIIDGERKSEKMDEEVKEVAEKMSDYAGSEKENLVKEIRRMSIIAPIAVIAYEVLNATGLAAGSVVWNNIARYCQTLVFVMVLLLPLYTTGLIEKINTNRKKTSLPKPVLLVLSAVAAFALAFIIKMVLSAVTGV